MDSDIRNNRILKAPLILLSWIGIVHFNDQICPLFHIAKGYLVTLIYILYNISQFIFLYQNRDDMALVTINGGTAGLYFSLYAKSLCSIFNRVKFNEMYADLHRNMKRIEKSGDGAQKKILDDHVRKGVKITLLLQSSIVLTVIFFIGYLTAVFFLWHVPGEPIRPFCVDTWFPYVKEDHVVLTFTIFIILASIDSLLIPEWNCMIISMLVYATSMLRILQYKLRNRDLYISKGTSEKNSQEERYRFIVGCIKEHLEIIKFLDDLKEIISIPMGIDFLNFALILCGQAFTGSKMDYGFELFFAWGYFIDIMLLALLYYWHATESTLEGQELALAAYESSWLDDDTAYRHAIMLMIQRSHRSVTLKAGLLPMNLGTYIMMLRASYSAFTILMQIN